MQEKNDAKGTLVREGGQSPALLSELGKGLAKPGEELGSSQDFSNVCSAKVRAAFYQLEKKSEMEGVRWAEGDKR